MNQPQTLPGHRRILLGEMLKEGDIFFNEEGTRYTTFDYGRPLTNEDFTYFRKTNELDDLKALVASLQARIEKLETAAPVREIHHHYPAPVIPQWPTPGIPIGPYFGDPILPGPTCGMGAPILCISQAEK